MQVARSIWRFLREEKLYWITPIVVLLVALVVLILLMESSAVLPYEYTVP